MIAGFSFVHDDRTYTCIAEAGPGEASEPWWWFTVNRDGNRYAPFRAMTKDTRTSVQAKIVAYYANHLAHRAMPESQHWARRPKGVGTAGAPGTPGGPVLPPAVVAARAAMAAKAAAAKAAAEAEAKSAVKAAAVAVKPAAKAALARPAAKLARPTTKAPARPVGKLRLVPKSRPAGKLKLVKTRSAAKGR
ncbi:MAG: hypothetical protein ABSB58_06500 [Gemmatimonadales bacterium]|jgi:hypothetical protein